MVQAGEAKGEVGVVNLPLNLTLPDNIKSTAKDSILELYIKTKHTKKFLHQLVASQLDMEIHAFSQKSTIQRKGCHSSDVGWKNKRNVSL